MTKAPDLVSFKNYSKRGYSYTQNVIANMILKVATGNPQANIAVMSSPIPGSVYVSD